MAVNYLTFLLQWYNWPYLGGLALVAGTLVRPGLLEPAGRKLTAWLGIERAAPVAVLRVFGMTLGIFGLTVSGALHDYWPAAQERGFVPGLLLTLILAAAVTRGLGRVFERHFPEVKAIGWGGRGLTGREGRVVSRTVSPDYRAGRAQVMGENEMLHMVMCKTREGEVPFGSVVRLAEYDESDGRYFVERVSGVSEPE